MSPKYVHMTDSLYKYMLEQRTNASDPVLEALRAEISPDQSSFMTVLVAALGVKWAAEVGTFTGMSSISIARGMLPGGKLFCFDQEFKWTSIARRYWMRAGVHERIDMRLGDAPRLLAHFRPPAPLDFVFVDADKESYENYFELLLPMVRSGGLMLFDNMLRGGKLIDPLEKNTLANRTIDLLNRKLAVDPRVQSVMIPIADGLYICRKR
jgi:caffeoyl-CoA O-methyltransferase